MTRYSFTVPGNPVPKARPRVVDGHAYTERCTAEYEEAVRMTAHATIPHPLKVPVRVSLIFWRGTHRRCDLDNLIKAALDGLNGVAFKDDDLVYDIHAAKGVDTANPCTFVDVEEMWPGQLQNLGWAEI